MKSPDVTRRNEVLLAIIRLIREEERASPRAFVSTAKIVS